MLNFPACWDGRIVDLEPSPDQVAIPEEANELHVFKLFISNAVIDNLVVETNSYPVDL